MTEKTRSFIRGHRTDDVRALALQAAKYPEVDMSLALTQISGWQILRNKVPTWAACEAILYPPHLSLEQCSSELTARYKVSIIENRKGIRDTLADLTGGFGIDCAFLSSLFRQADYVERQEMLCDIARHNFPALGLTHVDVHHADSVEYLEGMTPVDWIFIDPARRDGHGGKVIAIADCEPDVSALEELLLTKSRQVLVKLSPMLDLRQALHDLRHVAEAHIVSVANECKEMLLVLSKEADLQPDEVPIHCVNLGTAQPPLTFTRQGEQEAVCHYADTPCAYLYEPNASILKAGAFRTLASIYNMVKLHPNSHLYTSDTLLPDFPGRIFHIEGWCGFGKKEVKDLLDGVKQANLTIRNFPASVGELRKRLKLTEGGDVYLFATTIGERKILIRCRKYQTEDGEKYPLPILHSYL